MGIKGKVQGIIALFFGLALTAVGWYLIPATADMMEITLLKVIFWIGALTTWVTAVIILPMILIQDGKLTFWHGLKGAIAFVLGAMGSLIGYWVVPAVITAMENITGTEALGYIGWGGLIIIWILGMIVMPPAEILGGDFERILAPKTGDN